MYKRDKVKDIFSKFFKWELTDEDYDILKWYMFGFMYISELFSYDKSDMFHSFLLKLKQTNPDWDNMSDKHKYCYIRKAFRRELVWRISKTRNFTARHPIVIVHSKFDDDCYEYSEDEYTFEDKPVYDSDTIYLWNDILLEDETDMEKKLDDKLLCECIYNYVKLLSDRERTVFYLYYKLGYTHKEIGRELSISDEYARQILLRVKNKIKANFDSKSYLR